ncbi:natriuretic peptide A-like [Acanthopagrus latus]|uniref:natriuretic peptide A-like n=1 Tax=Acanthopagrus latus TaxID=8177 RepID=UPI00187CB0F9|nr:natriuretic peptide A-like [Acanthopagrus latus]
MNANISVCCLSLLLLLHFVRAKPVSDLQNLKQLLEEINTAQYYPSSEEMEVKRDKSVFGAPEQDPWSSSDHSSPSDPPAAKENVLASLLRDLMRTSKRSWSRYKKGGLRSCFGVRLERIGSFSGLGC